MSDFIIEFKKSGKIIYDSAIIVHQPYKYYPQYEYKIGDIIFDKMDRKLGVIIEIDEAILDSKHGMQLCLSGVVTVNTDGKKNIKKGMKLFVDETTCKVTLDSYHPISCGIALADEIDGVVPVHLHWSIRGVVR